MRHAGLQSIYQLGKRDRQAISKRFEHCQAGVLFASFNFRKVASVHSKEVSHFHLGPSLSDPEGSDSLSELRFNILSHPSIVAGNLRYSVRNSRQVRLFVNWMKMVPLRLEGQSI
jgi:hypothetical protein